MGKALKNVSLNQLLARFISEYPFQPATAFCRAFEVKHIMSFEFPTGLGLDLGCGDGVVTKIISEYLGDSNWVGVDVDAEEARFC